MLNLLSSATRNCEGTSRRSFLQVGTLAGLGLSLPNWLAAKRAQAEGGKSAGDTNCILIWTRGGTSHHDCELIAFSASSSLSCIPTWTVFGVLAAATSRISSPLVLAINSPRNVAVSRLCGRSAGQRLCDCRRRARALSVFPGVAGDCSLRPPFGVHGDRNQCSCHLHRFARSSLDRNG